MCFKRLKRNINVRKINQPQDVATFMGKSMCGIRSKGNKEKKSKKLKGPVLSQIKKEIKYFTKTEA